MTRNPLFMAALVAVVLLPVTSHADKRIGEPFDLGVGQAVLITDAGFSVGFDFITGDSRCPRNVECIWEGNAAAQVWAETTRNDRRFFGLNTNPQFQTEGTYLGFVIRLLNVTPFPVDGINIDPSEYILTLVVLESDAAVPTREKTWGAFKEVYR